MGVEKFDELTIETCDHERCNDEELHGLRDPPSSGAVFLHGVGDTGSDASSGDGRKVFGQV
jgi:hypothetical protein